MKKTIVVFLTLAMALCLCSCGKSKDVKAAEDAISAIGTVTLDSAEAIEYAEKLYNILTDSEKSDVSNRITLVEARESFDRLRKEQIYHNAKTAYDKLNEAASICIKGMDDIYGAWYFGIYKADDCTTLNLYTKFAAETPHFSSSQLELAAKALNLNTYTVKSDWQYCLDVVEIAILADGSYDKLDFLLADARSVLQELTETYGDYEYYPKLKDLYSKVSSYAEFFKSPSGSFKQLADTINDYENTIRTYQTDIGFLF